MKLLFKIPSFEDRWLNHAKNDIKLINNDKKFITLFKNDNHKINIDIDNTEKIILDEESRTKEKYEKNKINDFNTFINSLIKSPKLKASSSSDAILPSISRNRNIENSYKYSSFYNSLNNSRENNLIKTSLNSFKSTTIFNNTSESNHPKNNFKKTSIKISLKKFNNCYEVKDKYEKMKINFYNNSEIFINNKERKNKDKNQMIIQNSLQ